MRRVGEVHDVQVAADTPVTLAQVVRPAVWGESAHVTMAAGQIDVGQQDRVTAVLDAVNGKPRAVELGHHQEVALGIGLHSLVRGQRRRSVVQVGGHPWMRGVGGIHHRDAVMLLQRSIVVGSVVGAVAGVRRPILRICPLACVLAHELQVAVVGAFGIAVEEALLDCGLPLQPVLGVIPRTALGLGDRPHPWHLAGTGMPPPDGRGSSRGDSSAEQRTQQRDEYRRHD